MNCYKRNVLNAFQMWRTDRIDMFSDERRPVGVEALHHHDLAVKQHELAHFRIVKGHWQK